MVRKHVGKLALAVAAGVGLGWAWLAPSPPAPALPTVVTEHSARTADPGVPHTFTGNLAATAVPTAIPLAAQLDHLLATGDPEDAYKAYVLIQGCMEFLERGDLYTMGTKLPSSEFPQLIGLSAIEKQKEAVLCSGLTERMRTSRLDYLATAARAGVTGADLVFYLAGPFGDKSALVTRPNDLLVQQWKQQAVGQLTATAKKGNVTSLMTLMEGHRNGNYIVEKNPMLALTYLLALRKMLGQDFYPESSYPTDPSLTADQLAAAARDAAAIVAANEDFRLRHKGK